MNNKNFTIFNFYQFKKNLEIEKIKKFIREFCFFHKIRGTVLLAAEGINGSVAGLNHSINFFKSELEKTGFDNLECKFSEYKFMPFNRLKVKSKKEIITFSKIDLDVENNTATHIDPQKWNQLINDKEVLTIDVRNNFEIKLGSFSNSKNPKTKNITEFKKYINKKLLEYKDKKIAMFCTGGIRCEKASSYMKKKGFNNLYQLKGGILNYLKTIPERKSEWKGECFVFDNRVSISNDFKQGSYVLCHGCRIPVSKKDQRSNKYIKGISCAKCYSKLSLEKKKKLYERNKQIKISKKKGIYNPYIKFNTSNFF